MADKVTISVRTLQIRGGGFGGPRERKVHNNYLKILQACILSNSGVLKTLSSYLFYRGQCSTLFILKSNYRTPTSRNQCSTNVKLKNVFLKKFLDLCLILDSCARSAIYKLLGFSKIKYFRHNKNRNKYATKTSRRYFAWRIMQALKNNYEIINLGESGFNPDDLNHEAQTKRGKCLDCSFHQQDLLRLWWFVHYHVLYNQQ